MVPDELVYQSFPSSFPNDARMRLFHSLRERKIPYVVKWAPITHTYVIGLPEHEARVLNDQMDSGTGV